MPLAQEMARDILLFSANDDRSVPLLILAVHGSLLGSIISILVRIQDYLLNPTLSPVLIYVSVISKPLLSVAVAVLAFAVLKAGVISFIGVDFNGPAAPYLAWVWPVSANASPKTSSSVPWARSESPIRSI